MRSRQTKAIFLRQIRSSAVTLEDRSQQCTGLNSKIQKFHFSAELQKIMEMKNMSALKSHQRKHNDYWLIFRVYILLASKHLLRVKAFCNSSSLLQNKSNEYLIWTTHFIIIYVDSCKKVDSGCAVIDAEVVLHWKVTMMQIGGYGCCVITTIAQIK